MLENLLNWVIETLIYSFLGVIIMMVVFLLLELITKTSIKKELIEDENIALWVMFAGFFIAIGIIIAAAII